MKHILKKLLSITIAVGLIITMIPAASFTASAAQGWSNVGYPGFLLFYRASSLSIVTDSSGTPYISFESASDKATVEKFNGKSWVPVGSAVSDGQADSISMTCYKDTLYVAYADYTQAHKATVKKFDGTDWVTVGTAGFSDGWANGCNLAFDSNGTPYIGYADGSQNYYGNATIKKYNGADWVSVDMTNFPTYRCYTPKLAFNSKDVLYITYSNPQPAQNGRISVMKYDSTKWEYVGSQSFSEGQAGYTSIAFDSNDTPFVAFSNCITAASYNYYGKTDVMKYNASSNSWDYVGGKDFSGGTVADMSFVLYNDTPYVAYTDITNGQKMTVMKYNSASSEWENVGNPDFSSGKADYTDLTIDKNGTPYVIFSDYSSNMFGTVMSFGEMKIPLTAPTITLSSDTVNGGLSYTITPVSGETDKVDHYQIFVRDNDCTQFLEIDADASNLTGNIPLSKLTSGKSYIAFAQAISKTTATNYLDSDPGAPSTAAIAVTATPDTTAPAAPTVKPVNDQNTTVTGTAEANSTVAVKDSTGKTIGTVTADSNGNYSVTISAQTAGTILSVTATDAAKNESAATKVTVTAVDATAPAAPTVKPVNDQNTTVTGIAEANSTVTVKDSTGKTIGTATADSNGNYSVTIPAQTAGTVLCVTATDAAKNESTATNVTVTATDTTAPAAPTVKPVNNQNTTVTGIAEANSTVTVKDSGGKTIGTATADSNGNYSVTIPAQAASTVLCVTATDAAKNESTAAKVTVTAVDTTAPVAPTVKPVNSQDTTVTGIAEANSTVTVKDSAGKTIGTATADTNGNYSVTIPAQAAGTVLCVTATDAAKNESTAAKVTVSAVDTTAPVAPTVKPVNSQNTAVSGIAEANSTVTVKDSGGKTIGTATADSGGNYSVTIPAQAAGTVLCVTATDAAKNESTAAKVTVTAADTPVSPTPADTVINKIDALPDPDTASEKTIQDNQQNIKDTKQLYDALSSSDRDSIDSNRKNKLEKLIDRLDALLVIVPEDPNTGITAAGIGTAVLIPELADPDSGKVLVQLSVNKVPDTNRPANIVRAINVMSDNGKKVIATYDVSLLKSIFGASGNLLSSKKVSNSEIVGYITIRIPVPDDYSDNLNLTVAYIDDNGNVTPLTTTIVTENGVKYLQFTTNHFSEYAIIANSPSSAPTSPVSTSSATQTSSAAQDSISNPSTGHTGCENIIYVFLSCITALIAFRVFRRKKEREHF